jgi:hypothetical protein
MIRSILLAFVISSLNSAVFANIEQVEARPIKTKEKQKMELAPSTTTLGGARSGDFEKEKNKDDEKIKHDLEKQKMLYENEGYYRRGL